MVVTDRCIASELSIDMEDGKDVLQQQKIYQVFAIRQENTSA